MGSRPQNQSAGASLPVDCGRRVYELGVYKFLKAEFSSCAANGRLVVKRPTKSNPPERPHWTVDELTRAAHELPSTHRGPDARVIDVRD